MKRTVPLLIAAVCGFVLIISSFIPATVSWGETATVWFDVLAAIAFILGGGNLLKVHLKKVSERTAGWAYSLITVVTFLLTLFVGLSKWGVPPGNDQEYFGYTFAPLAAQDLPEELTFRLPVDLPGQLAEETLPASVRRQFFPVLAEEEDRRIVRLEFRGWITSGQREDLLNLHQLLDWKCAIEQLADLAQIPPELADFTTYFADHSQLGILGVLSEQGEAELLTISGSAPWKRSVEQLARDTRRVTTVELHSIPEQIAAQLPESVANSLEDAPTFIPGAATLNLIGPLTPGMRADMLGIFPRIRPLSDEQIEEFVQEFEQRGALGEEQQNLLRGLQGSIWQTDQLIDVLNEAGERPPITKSYCELREEMRAGVPDLSPERPSDEEDVELNAEQMAFINAAVLNPEQNLEELGAELQAIGPWIPAQQQALKRFLGRLPSVNQWNRNLAVALTATIDERTNKPYRLNPAQAEFLLAGYREEHLWNNEVHRLYMAAHQVKYPWSGGYLQDGSPFWWSYEYAFKPLTATMFALLAFYVASAAFRAFRAKNLEALLLLSTAFLILLGRTPMGVALTAWLPDSLSLLKVENMTAFVMSVINTAGNRAIMIGIALGIVSTSLKILLGVDRSYLGTGD